MKQHYQLIAVDVATGGALDHSGIGDDARQVRLHFSQASTFPSPEDHKLALHREVSDHAQMLYHHYGLMPDDLVPTEHEGRPAFLMIVRRL